MTKRGSGASKVDGEPRPGEITGRYAIDAERLAANAAPSSESDEMSLDALDAVIEGASVTSKPVTVPPPVPPQARTVSGRAPARSAAPRVQAPPPVVEDDGLVDSLRPFYKELEGKTERAEVDIADLTLQADNPYLASSLVPPAEKAQAGGSARILIGVAAVVAFAAGGYFAFARTSEQAAQVREPATVAAAEPAPAAVAAPTAPAQVAPSAPTVVAPEPLAVPAVPAPVPAEPAPAAAVTDVAEAKPAAVKPVPVVAAPSVPTTPAAETAAPAPAAVAAAVTGAVPEVSPAQPASAATPAAAPAAPVAASTDATAAPAAVTEVPAVPANLPETPSREEVAAGFDALKGDLATCAAGKTGVVLIDATLASSGRISYALIDGKDFKGTPEGSCMARAVRKARFPQFSQPTLKVRYPVQL